MTQRIPDHAFLLLGDGPPPGEAPIDFTEGQHIIMAIVKRANERGLVLNKRQVVSLADALIHAVDAGIDEVLRILPEACR